MPRHFLVKRHKHCGATLSYRDRLNEGQEGVTIASNNTNFVTTIIDTDKHIIIRDGDQFSDYSGYSSPDSGYAASPNSAQAGLAREKENVGTDRENNNNRNFNKMASVVGFYDNDNAVVNSLHHHRHHHSSSINNFDGSHHYTDNSSDSRFMIVDPPDAPIDLSMPNRKKNVLSSVPAYLQHENHRHHQIHHHNKNQQQQQQQQHVYQRPPSPDYTPPSSAAAAAAAAVVYFNSFNNFYLKGKADRSLCALMPPLSPSHTAYNSTLPLPLPRSETTRPSAHYQGSSMKTDVLSETSTAAAHPEILPRAQCITVPTATPGQRLSSSSSISSSLSPQPPTAIIVREQVTSSLSDRLTPQKTTSSPLQSPSRKRVISEDQDELSNQSCYPFDCYPFDLSKSAPVLKKTDQTHNPVTPTSKGTNSSSTQPKAKTAAPAVRKSQTSTPSGKKLKAVRRLNFDIDTTSPVSGTIIKDAADFHPEEGKVVYGDIEPSFNFVDVTPEARAELEKIENKIGDYICQLCKEFYEDAFQLAQHRCSRIVHVEYRCPECEKVFNCPANLASHRRWHKPRANGQTKANGQGMGKPMSVNQKIAPKPDCNGNNVTGMLSAAAVRTTSPSNSATGLDPGKSDAINNIRVRTEVDGSNNVHTAEVSLPANVQPLTSTSSAASISDSMTVNTKTRSPICTFLDNSNSSSESEQNSSASNPLKRSSPNPIPDDVQMPKSSKEEPPHFLYTTQQQDAHFRPSSVIATNPLHTTTTFGSTLTPEEKSLVLQVLNSHHKQYQTTTITSTTTVMTPLVSDSHCNIMNPENRAFVNEQKMMDDDSEHTVSHDDDADCMESTSSPPLDLTQAGDPYKQIDLLHPKQQQKQNQQQSQMQQRKAGALSERQGNPQIECSLCGKKFQRQAYLRKHMHSQHNKQNTVMKNSDFSTNSEAKAADLSIKSNVAASMNTDFNVPTQITATSCGICSKSFSSESARLKHEAVIHGLTPHLACSTCGMSFTSKAALDKHTRSAHSTEVYSCKYCSSTFHSSPGLTRHINKCHPTENRQVILLQLPASRTC